MKNISNYTLNEIKELLIDIPYDIVEIVYGYYHRNKTRTVEAYARSVGISVATLYRYKNLVENSFRRHQR